MPSSETPPAAAPKTSTLTAADRCDRCGAQAYLRLEFAPGLELLFCGHHVREHREKIAQLDNARVQDETSKLGMKPVGS